MPRHRPFASHLFLPFLALLGVLSSALPALAQEDEATRTAAARALFESGLEDADAERWDVAASAFRRALDLRGSPIIRLNLAIALGHLGQVVEASELLRAVIRDPAAPEDARANASETLSTLEPRIAWIRLHYRGDRTRAGVRIDGRPVSWALVDAPIPQDSGAHVVAVHIEGRDPISEHLVLAPGASREVSLDESRDASATTLGAPAWGVNETPGAPVGAPSGPEPWAIGLGVAGGVVLLAGTITIVLVLALPTQATPIPGDLGVIEVGR